MGRRLREAPRRYGAVGKQKSQTWKRNRPLAYGSSYPKVAPGTRGSDCQVLTLALKVKSEAAAAGAAGTAAADFFSTDCMRSSLKDWTPDGPQGALTL